MFTCIVAYLINNFVFVIVAVFINFHIQKFPDILIFYLIQFGKSCLLNLGVVVLSHKNNFKFKHTVLVFNVERMTFYFYLHLFSKV